MKRLTSKSVPQPCDVAGAAVQKREKKIEEGHDTKNTPRENKAVTQTPYAMEGENKTSHDHHHHHQIFDMLTFCQGSKHNLLHDHVIVLLLNTLSYIILYDHGPWSIKVSRQPKPGH